MQQKAQRLPYHRKGVAWFQLNDEVEFNAACSPDVDEYAWEFGDGASTTGAKVQHKYNVAGTFNVKMTAKNDSKSFSASRNVTIVP